MFQPRVGFAWTSANKQKSVLRASWGHYNATQNMLTQVGALTTNGVQHNRLLRGLRLARASSENPDLADSSAGAAVAPGTFPAGTARKRL